MGRAHVPGEGRKPLLLGEASRGLRNCHGPAETTWKWRREPDASAGRGGVGHAGHRPRPPHEGVRLASARLLAFVSLMVSSMSVTPNQILPAQHGASAIAHFAVRRGACFEETTPRARAVLPPGSSATSPMVAPHQMRAELRLACPMKPRRERCGCCPKRNSRHELETAGPSCWLPSQAQAHR